MPEVLSTDGLFDSRQSGETIVSARRHSDDTGPSPLRPFREAGRCDRSGYTEPSAEQWRTRWISSKALVLAVVVLLEFAWYTFGAPDFLASPLGFVNRLVIAVMND